jgi:hypothetical protein
MDKASLLCIIVRKVHKSLKEALIRFVGQFFLVEANEEIKTIMEVHKLKGCLEIMQQCLRSLHVFH